MENVTNNIMWERLEIGFSMADKIVKKNNLKISDYEKLDIATRIANALFIEKNKSFRADKIEKRQEESFK